MTGQNQTRLSSVRYGCLLSSVGFGGRGWCINFKLFDTISTIKLRWLHGFPKRPAWINDLQEEDVKTCWVCATNLGEVDWFCGFRWPRVGKYRHRLQQMGVLIQGVYAQSKFSWSFNRISLQYFKILHLGHTVPVRPPTSAHTGMNMHMQTTTQTWYLCPFLYIYTHIWRHRTTFRLRIQTLVASPHPDSLQESIRNTIRILNNFKQVDPSSVTTEVSIQDEIPFGIDRTSLGNDS